MSERDEREQAAREREGRIPAAIVGEAHRSVHLMAAAHRYIRGDDGAWEECLDALPPRLRAFARTSGRVHHELARHVRDGMPLGEALAHVCDHLDPMELHGLITPDRLPDGAPPSHWIPWCARPLPCGRRCAALGVVPMQQVGGSTCWASCEDCARALEREGTARRR